MSTSIAPVANTPKYGRLLAKDIVRLPDKTAVKDFYARPVVISQSEAKRLFRKKLFTGATFGLVGLWLAHRNHLFNPIHREAKKIIRNEVFQNEIRKFVEENVSERTFIRSTKRFLKSIIKENKRKPEIITETKKALEQKKVFKQLYAKVKEVLNDDKATLKDGYTVDLLDRLQIKVEKDLAKNREHGLPYKEQGEKILKALTAKNAEGQSPLSELLYEAITTRSSSTIEEFIKNAALDTKLNVRA